MEKYWYQLGILSIRARWHPKQANAFLRGSWELFKWLQWAPDPADRASKRSFATLGALQSAVRRAGLGRVAADLKI